MRLQWVVIVVFFFLKYKLKKKVKILIRFFILFFLFAGIETKFTGSSCNDLVTSDGAGSTIISGHLDQRIRFWDTRADSSSDDILVNGKVTSLDLTRGESSSFEKIRQIYINSLFSLLASSEFASYLRGRCACSIYTLGKVNLNCRINKLQNSQKKLFFFSKNCMLRQSYNINILYMLWQLSVIMENN